MMTQMIEFFSQPVFSIGSTPTSWAELLGFISGALCVYWVVRQNILTYPVGMINAFFFWLLFIDARLYADAWLQMVYVVLNVVGWVAWLKAGPNRGRLSVGRARRRELAGGLLFVAAATYGLYPILQAAHGSAPLFDSLTTSLSLAAMGLMCFKRLEHWYFWIVADLIYIPLYVYKDLYLTAGVYVLFLGLCVMGLRQWRHAVREQEAPPAQVEGTGPALLPTPLLEGGRA